MSGPSADGVATCVTLFEHKFGKLESDVHNPYITTYDE